MDRTAHNIQVVTRAISPKHLAHRCANDEELAADVDICWHCVTEKLDAGLIEETIHESAPWDIEG